MSAKNIIQKLQDSDLIRLFLEFVQTFHLQYEKSNKEISYKCYEATWVISQNQATGYGRTQSEAYKHALRNLLEILIENPHYTEFFIETLTTSNQYELHNSRTSGSRLSKANGTKGHTVTSKTQGHELSAEYTTTNDHQSKSQVQHSKEKITKSKQKVNGKSYESSKKITASPLSPLNVMTNSLQHQSSASKLTQPENKLTSSLSVYHSRNQQNCPPRVGFLQAPSRKESQNSNHSHHSRINLSSSQQKISKGNSNYQTKQSESHLHYQQQQQHSQQHKVCQSSQSSSEQLRQAIQRLSELESYLEKLNHENEALQDQLCEVERQKHKQTETQHPNDCALFRTEQQIESTTHFDNNNAAVKPKIPKLKLEILPNYHKKAEKPLNDSLMAAYNEKRNPSLKKIAC